MAGCAACWRHSDACGRAAAAAFAQRGRLTSSYSYNICSSSIASSCRVPCSAVQQRQRRRLMSSASSRGGGDGPAGAAGGQAVSAELFALTYGALVRQLLDDVSDVSEVNAALRRVGRSMGVRAVDEFLAKSGAGAAKCTTFRQAAEAAAGPAMRMFLGVQAAVGGWSAEGDACSLRLSDNPITDLVELPEGCETLQYCAVLCGALEGALEAVDIHTRAEVARDALKGDEATEIRLTLVRMGAEEFPYRDD